MASEWDFSNLGGFNASLDALAEAIKAATYVAMQESAEVIVRAARLQFNGQHPPGTRRTVGGNRPQSISENLKNSIHVVTSPFESAPGQFIAQVAPTMIYGRRIELGFHGVDSLGRDFTNPGQPPYPYLAPGVEKARVPISDIFRSRWQSVFAA